MPTARSGARTLARLNQSVWAVRRVVRSYDHRRLRPVEVVLLARYRDELSGTVLELGCGAGRITGYLAQLAQRTYGIDVSLAMIEACRRRYPTVELIHGDLVDVGRFADRSLDAVIAGFDVLDDDGRRRVLQSVRRVLSPGGLLLMSSHNRRFAAVKRPFDVRWRSSRLPLDLAGIPANLIRHARLRRLERDTADYALRSDGTHGFSLVLYYITPEAQFRQLEQEGFQPVECLDLEGNPVSAEFPPADVPELHYVARVP